MSGNTPSIITNECNNKNCGHRWLTIGDACNWVCPVCGCFAHVEEVA